MWEMYLLQEFYKKKKIKVISFKTFKKKKKKKKNLNGNIAQDLFQIIGSNYHR